MTTNRTTSWKHRILGGKPLQRDLYMAGQDDDREDNAPNNNNDDPNTPQGSGPGPNPPGQPNMVSRGTLGWAVVAVLAVFVLVLMASAHRQAEQVTWKQFYNYAKADAFEGPVIIDKECGVVRKKGAPAQACDRQPHMQAKQLPL